MRDNPALDPLDERPVDFYGDQVTAVFIEENGQRQVYVPFSRLRCTWA